MTEFFACFFFFSLSLSLMVTQVIYILNLCKGTNVNGRLSLSSLQYWDFVVVVVLNFVCENTETQSVGGKYEIRLSWTVIFVRWNVWVVPMFWCQKKSDGGIFYEHHDDQVKVSVFKLRLMIKALFFQSKICGRVHACQNDNFFTMRCINEEIYLNQALLQYLNII